MRFRPLAFVLAFASFASFAAACSSSDPAAAPSTAPLDASSPDVSDAGADDAADATADAAPDLGQCASTFGDQLTAGFGRLDGTLVAVVRPVDQACAMPNGDHVVLQVRVNGAVYRMVVNVKSDRAGADPRVQVATAPHALGAPAFAEGWHAGVTLDYATDLGLHAGDFTPMDQDPLVAKVVAQVRVGDPISVYATSGKGRPDSAHLIHRNGNGDDGAIVVGPTSASPTFLAFHFVDQTF